MKRISILSILLFAFLATAVLAAFPVIEPFNGPTLQNTWEQFWTLDATLEVVTAGTDGIPDSPLGDGYFGRSTGTTTGYMSCGNVTGEDTDADYTIKAYVYTPVVNTTDEPDDFWYQMLIFYRDSGGYGRFHTQFNTNTGAIPHPRIRLQITNPSFAYTQVWEDPTDFTCPASSSWHKLRAEISGTTAVCYFDDVQLPGTCDWTSEAASRNAGKFGFGQYIDGAGTRSLYVDMFKAYKGAEPPDPTPTPAPLNAQNWTLYE